MGLVENLSLSLIGGWTLFLKSFLLQQILEFSRAIELLALSKLVERRLSIALVVLVLSELSFLRVLPVVVELLMVLLVTQIPPFRVSNSGEMLSLLVIH
jgi:hypothetical protein